jgi:dihydroxyacetone kinase
MTNISQAQIERAIETTCATVLRNEAYFSDLDGLAGDGDFGTSLATGFRVIEKDFPEIDRSSIGAMLLKISMLVSKHVGGSSGPIWGTGFMKAAMPSKGKEAVSLQELADMVGTAVDGIQARGGAKLGDKTLLDALIPVHEKLKEHAASDNADLGACLKDCADAADEAIDAVGARRRSVNAAPPRPIRASLPSPPSCRTGARNSGSSGPPRRPSSTAERVINNPWERISP